jgi:hypothetical protein
MLVSVISDLRLRLTAGTTQHRARLPLVAQTWANDSASVGDSVAVNYVSCDLCGEMKLIHT